jgi:hypothetical protein
VVCCLPRCCWVNPPVIYLAEEPSASKLGSRWAEPAAAWRYTHWFVGWKRYVRVYLWGTCVWCSWQGYRCLCLGLDMYAFARLLMQNVGRGGCMASCGGAGTQPDMQTVYAYGNRGFLLSRPLQRYPTSLSVGAHTNDRKGSDQLWCSVEL